MCLLLFTFIPKTYLTVGEILSEWDQNDLIIFNHFNILRRIVINVAKVSFLIAEFD